MVIMAFAMVSLMGLVGLAVDTGRLFVARAQLTRTADAAALAGVQSFPIVSNAIAKAQTYGLYNDPSATIVATQVGNEKKLRVTASKTVNMTFMKVLGFNSKTVSATAVAGFGGILDVVIVLDETGSMAGQPMTDGQNAAKTLIDMLLPDPSGNTKVALASYKSCYRNVCNPPTNNNADDSAVPTSHVVALTDNAATLKTAVNQTYAGGTTNICHGMWKGQQLLNGPEKHTHPDTQRVMLVLADGDNNPQHSAYMNWPAACNPGGDSSTSGSGCQSTSSREANLDLKMYQLAQAIKADNIEIFSVGLSVCGSTSSTTCTSTEASRIGNTAYSDTSADRRLMKCIASSTPGTNDHYIEAANSSQLQAIFQAIGSTITTRLVE
jgi:Flp pilus assembly protein TadG